MVCFFKIRTQHACSLHPIMHAAYGVGVAEKFRKYIHQYFSIGLHILHQEDKFQERDH